MYDYTKGDRVIGAPEKPKPEESPAVAATKAGERFIEACRRARVHPKTMLAVLLCRTGETPEPIKIAMPKAAGEAVPSEV